MNRQNCLVKLIEIKKQGFHFTGNECEYALEVYSPEKVLLGKAEVRVVQGGTEYSEEESELSEEQYEEELIGYYYEEFAEQSDEEGFMTLEAFADNYTFGEIGSFEEMDFDLPLEKMFDRVGWFSYEPSPQDVARYTIDINSPKGQQLLAGLTKIVDEEFHDLDLVCGYVNVQFGGDYSREQEAEKKMNEAYPQIAECIYSNLQPYVLLMDPDDWKAQACNIMNLAAKYVGCVYQDNDDDLFEIGAAKAFDFFSLCL